MILSINTVKENSEKIEIILLDNKKQVSRKIVSAKAKQAEKLIPAIDALLKKEKISLKKIKKIQVENSGGSFTALRIGVATANALAYALNLSVEGTAEEENSKLSSNELGVIRPIYSREANITIGKNKLKK